MPSRSDDEPARLSPPTERALAVLEVVAAEPDRRWTLLEIAKATSVSKTTALGIVNVLLQRGYLVRDGDGIGPGPAFSRFSAVVNVDSDVLEIARRLLVPFTQQNDALIAISVARPRGVLLLDLVGSDPERYPIRPGVTTPWVATGAAYAAFIAWYPDGFIQNAFRGAAAPRDPKWQAEAREVIAKCRHDGFWAMHIDPSMIRMYSLLASLEHRDVPDAVREEARALFASLRGIYEEPPTGPSSDAVLNIYCPVFDRRGKVAAVLTAYRSADGNKIEDELSLAVGFREVGRAITDEIGGVDPWKSSGGHG